MSATLAAIGFGFALSHSTTSGGTYTAIGAITDLKPNKITVAKVEIARNDSPDLFGEVIPGWKNGGEYDATLVYDKTSYAAINALVGTPLYWKFIRPDGVSSSAFQGFISELGDEVPLKQAMQVMLKITVNGGQTFTAG